MADSPRERRLRNDFAAIQKLQSESTILDFAAIGSLPESYTLIFRGLGVWKPENHPDVITRDEHQVVVRFNANYPRMMPELAWKTPIFHPNISSSGVVCLGGYGTYWVPSVTLDELCTMLWDMIRYKNFDPESPYNRQAALWAKQHSASRFPIDPRPIRNKIATAANGSPALAGMHQAGASTSARPTGAAPSGVAGRSVASTIERLFTASRPTQSPFRTSTSSSSPFAGPPASHMTPTSRAVGNGNVASSAMSSNRPIDARNSDPMSRAAAMLNPAEAEIVIAEVIDHAPSVSSSPVVMRPPSGDILFIE